jgi:hypothetical protein
MAALDHEVAQVEQARALLGGQIAPKKKVGRPKMNAKAPSTAEPAKKKRNLTPEERKRIADAVKRRRV